MISPFFSVSAVIFIAGTVGLQAQDHLSGGDTTVFQTSQNAFALPLANITRENKRGHVVGNSFFNSNWTVAPASASGRDGLGPLFHARSCSACHSRDGRGAPDQSGALLFRISTPENTPDPNYGDQIAIQAISGFEPEGEVKIEYTEVPGKFEDGTPFSLRKPTYTFLPNQKKYGDPTPNLQLGPRIAPPVFGVGLLEAIPEKTILALADPDDKKSRDGISGKPNFVKKKPRRIGRFGWKANQPSVRQQTAAAFFGDIGIKSSLRPDPSGSPPEIDDRTFSRVVLYQQTLAPPAQRDWTQPEVVRGRTLFHKANCVACHIPEMKTGPHPDGISELENQTIHAFTDLLLHDMGEELADGRPDFEATGREWKTPPLWGIGLTKTVNGHTFFLHDGRARNLEEAILWHGGEAKKSAEIFRTMSVAERSDLLAFLNSI